MPDWVIACLRSADLPDQLQRILGNDTPVRFLPDGGWKFTGYEDLPATVVHWADDRPLALRGRPNALHGCSGYDCRSHSYHCCIRLANLMNSEIIGKP